MQSPPASIVIPTRARLPYLEVALASIVREAHGLGAEVLVIDDAGPSPAARELDERLGARYEPHPRPLGLNVARNTGVERSQGELVVFVDDDVRACAGWLQALLDAARAASRRWTCSRARSCAAWRARAAQRAVASAPPITTLELGAARHRHARLRGARTWRSAVPPWIGWGRSTSRSSTAATSRSGRNACARKSPDARVLYVAGASVAHRRAGADARLRSLARGAYVRGRAARRFDARRGVAPPLAAELPTLAGCVGHVVRRRCPAGTDDGRPQRRPPAGGAARTPPTARGRRPAASKHRAARPPARTSCRARAAPSAGSTARAARRRCGARRVGAAQRPAAAPGAGGTPRRHRCGACWSSASSVRSAATLAAAIRDGAGALAPRRRAAHLRCRRPRQVREPQPAARRARRRGT